VGGGKKCSPMYKHEGQGPPKKGGVKAVFKTVVGVSSGGGGKNTGPPQRGVEKDGLYRSVLHEKVHPFLTGRKGPGRFTHGEGGRRGGFYDSPPGIRKRSRNNLLWPKVKFG